MAERRLRVLVGKPGLDGHDRGARMIAAAFCEAGFEVIYLGLQQTAEQVVSSAIQEDVDLIALSILSGAHHTHLTAVSNLLKEKKAGDIVFIAGGVIPEPDIPLLKQAGVREIFTSGTSTDTIVAWVKENLPRDLPGSLADRRVGTAHLCRGVPDSVGSVHPTTLAERVLDGDLRAAARLMREIDERRQGAIDELKVLYPHTGSTYLVGVTGPSGAGKSTLVDQIVTAYRKKDLLVGVIAVDASSPLSGGAILGDRIRMNGHADDAGVFIRSLATRGSQGGLSRSTADVVTVMEAMGMDVIVIETAGGGQDEADLASLAHTTAVVTVPGLGDDMQALQAGTLGVGDIFIVNRAGHEGADRTVRDLSAALEMRQPKPGGWNPRVVRTEVTTGFGIDQLMSVIEAHREHLKVSGVLPRLAREREARMFTEALRDELFQSVFSAILADGRYQQIIEGLQNRTTAPHSAARAVVKRSFS